MKSRLPRVTYLSCDADRATDRPRSVGEADVSGHEDPNQLRSEKKPHEGFNTRTKGFEQKFGPKSDLRSVSIKIQEHFNSHGMDSIMYLPDPESGKMRSVITHHQRFSVEKAREACDARSTKYDSYDVLNDTAGRKFLLDSLSSGLRQDVIDEMDSAKEPAAVVWMLIIEQLRSTDIQLYQSQKDKLKSIKPSQYRGEDVSQMVSDMRGITDELIKANQFEYSLILNILEACLEAGGQDNEEYRYPLMLRLVTFSRMSLSVIVKRPRRNFVRPS